MSLTTKQEIFVQRLIEGNSQREAYKFAYNAENMKDETIEKAIGKMIKVHSDYRLIENDKWIITKEGVEWLCKNCFKQKYLELLESYKMDLTEEFIKAGYIYDNFFNKN